MSKKRLLAASALAVSFLVLGPAALAAAPADTAFRKPYADNAEHTFFTATSLSTTQRDAAVWVMQNSVDSPTDMFDTRMTYQSSATDVVFSAATYTKAPYSGWYAWATCEQMVFLSDRCEQFTVKFNNKNPHSNYKALACHEVGHTIGFADGTGSNKDATTAARTCMRANPDVTKYASADVTKINKRY
jgi:hypothetical protein